MPQRRAPVLWKEYAVSLTTKGMQSKATSQYLTLMRIEPKTHVTYTRFSFQWKVRKLRSKVVSYRNCTYYQNVVSEGQLRLHCVLGKKLPSDRSLPGPQEFSLRWKSNPQSHPPMSSPNSIGSLKHTIWPINKHHAGQLDSQRYSDGTSNYRKR